MPQHSTPSEVEKDEEYEEDEKDETVSTSEDEEEDRHKDLIDSLTEEIFAWVRQPARMDRIIGQQHFSSDHHQSGSDVEHQRSLRNWIIPFPDYDSALPLGWVEQPPPVTGQLEVGSVFRSKAELRIAVGMYHLENMLECATDRSAEKHVVFICRNGRKNCTFRLCAMEGTTLWRISKLTLDHSCHANLSRAASRSVISEVAAFFFAKKLVGEGITLKPKEMILEMRMRYGVEMVYSFVLRTRNIAIERTYEEFEKSYHMLLSYLYLLKERNPGTIYDLQTTREGVFCRMFVALGQSIRAFEHLRPVIIVDGTHLKGKNKGVLFVAVTKDANEQIFPLAVGLGPIENDVCWTYFLYNLWRCFNPPEDLLIVSDQHKSIGNVVQVMYPNAVHGLCYHHLSKNLKCYGTTVATVFKQATYCYRVEEFENLFEKLYDESPNGAHRRLSQIGPERWARLKCAIRHYGFLTSNAAEQLNSHLLWARRLPVCSLIETFRQILENWFDKKRADAASRDHELTESTFDKLSLSVRASLHLPVRAMATHVYKVEENKIPYQVGLESWTCECREFDQDKIPCKHVVAAIRRAGNGLSVYDFVSRYFKQHTLRQTYAEHIIPMPHPGEWNVPSEISSILCYPSVNVRRAGRPRMSRARSAIENRATIRRNQMCSRCKGTGHNRKSCIASIPIGDVDLNAPLEEADGKQSRQRRRKKKRCSNCRREDHDIRGCPFPHREEM